MNRRAMLTWLAGGAAAATLIEPVARTIFLPPRGGWPSVWAYSRGSQLPSEIDFFDGDWAKRPDSSAIIAAACDDVSPLYYDEAAIQKLQDACMRHLATAMRVPERYLSGDVNPQLTVIMPRAFNQIEFNVIVDAES